jgi:predicted DNA-binding antitoxin AbrB/MazE fold protein/predicted nucleic acid-binding protein
MMLTTQAVYEGGVLRPVEPLTLPEGKTVDVIITETKLAGPPGRAPTPAEEDYARRIKAAKSLAEMHAVMATHPRRRMTCPTSSKRSTIVVGKLAFGCRIQMRRGRNRGERGRHPRFDAAWHPVPSAPTPHVLACRQWVADLRAAGRRVIVLEIADYEVRRELIRLGSSVALTNLDGYGIQLEYLPLTTAAMRLAAELWAQARNAGQPTAPDPALDGDAILAAQATALNTAVVVATGNPVTSSVLFPQNCGRTSCPESPENSGGAAPRRTRPCCTPQFITAR